MSEWSRQEEVPVDSKFLSTSVGTQKVESKFDVRSATKLIVAAGQQTSKVRGARQNDDGGSIRSVESAKKIERLLRDKRSFSELQDQKGECVIPCEEQLCRFPPLSEQESSQARQMDGGEIQVEEERRVRMKSVSALPTDKERNENEIMHVAIRSWCTAKDSRKLLVNESLVS